MAVVCLIFEYNFGMSKPKNVDEYLAGLDGMQLDYAKQMRNIILEYAPKAEEKISYGMPYYSLNGRLVYFQAHKNHLGFYPMKSAIAKFTKELKDYETAPGTVRFAYNQPLPVDLIKKIIEFRISENT